MKEKWRKIPGFKNYRVSNHGRVKSIDRQRTGTTPQGKPFTRLVEGKLLSPIGGKYLRVNLCKNGRTHQRTVHSLVALAFIGPPPKDQEVRHLDGNNRNNKADNLLYGTDQENANDRIRHGRSGRGDSPTAKLTEKDVKWIRKKYTPRDEMYGASALGRKFNVRHTTICNIVSRQTWAWL
jgi:hypothetical protein